MNVETQTGTIVTSAKEAIVTALREGPSSARDLSHLLEGIGYDNIRQTLGRLAKSGVVTKLRRGIYALADCDNGQCENSDCDNPAALIVTPEIVTPINERGDCDILSNVAAAFADYAALDDPRNPEVWA